ncbi:hypothetical protein TNCV_4673201 [Trichonephila clavipes]|nr:hypothetical protein TNCV_4673201 [Trichonephila clavipes]
MVLGVTTADIQENASTGILSMPGMYLISMVNCEMNSKWCSWRGLALSTHRFKANVKGLWSVCEDPLGSHFENENKFESKKNQ